MDGQLVPVEDAVVVGIAVGIGPRAHPVCLPVLVRDAVAVGVVGEPVVDGVGDLPAVGAAGALGRRAIGLARAGTPGAAVGRDAREHGRGRRLQEPDGRHGARAGAGHGSEHGRAGAGGRGARCGGKADHQDVAAALPRGRFAAPVRDGREQGSGDEDDRD